MAKTFRTNQTLVNSGFNQKSGCTLTLCGNNIIANTATFEYSTDRSGYFNTTPRAVPDVSYVTGLTANISLIGSNQQIIYRDVSGTTGATGFLYNNVTSGVTVPNLCISQLPTIQTGDYYILTWDGTTTKVNIIPALSVTGIQGGVNGLGVVGDNLCLGGTLISNTTIVGSGYSFCVNNINNQIVLENLSNGGIYLKSQYGASASYFDDFSNSVGFAINKSNSGFKVYDNRIGCCRSGIQYDGDYSNFYTPRSLVDKGYVDAVASGLSPHPAVGVATNDNIVAEQVIVGGRIIALSGLTGTTIIDGITISDGDRVLIKDQTDKRENGIYVLTGTTFVRAEDFNEDNESVHGTYTFVMSGDTNGSTSWVLSTPNPIAIGITPLTFTLFSQVTDITAGTGITISKYYGQNTISIDGINLAGDHINWGNNQFNVVPSGITSDYTTLLQFNTYTGDTETRLFGIENNITYISGITDTKLSTNIFTGYTANTDIRLVGIENDIGYISGITNTNYSLFTGYTASTAPILTTALTGATNGLDFLNRDVKLGGILVEDTTINLSTFDLNFSGDSLQYSADYSSTYTERSIPDVDYVTGYTQSAITQNSNVLNVTDFTGLTFSATTETDFIGASGGTTVYLPNPPKDGQRIVVADIAGNALTLPIIINGSEKLIVGASTSIINTDYGSITFIYNKEFWSAAAFIN